MIMEDVDSEGVYLNNEGDIYSVSQESEGESEIIQIVIQKRMKMNKKRTIKKEE